MSRSSLPPTPARRASNGRSIMVGAAILLGAPGLAACGSDSVGEDASRSVAEVSVSSIWSRTSPTVNAPGVVYFDIISSEGDSLLGVTVGTDIAADAQLHQTRIGGNNGAESTEDQEMGAMNMTMVRVDAVSLPAGQAISFKPGSYHVMLLDLVNPLQAGQEFELTFHFDNAGDLTLPVTVRDTPPTN